MFKFALHSVSYSGTWGGQCRLPLESIISKAKEFGYDGIEIAAKRPHGSVLDLDSDSRKRLKDLIKSKGLEIPCLAGYNDFADPSPYNREINQIYVREVIKLANDLDTGLVRVFASGMGAMHKGASFEEQWGWVRENLIEVVKYAGDQGIVLGLQNHPPIMHSYHNVLQMIKEVDSDNLKAIIDAPLLFQAGEGGKIEEAVEKTGDLMVYCHTGAHKLLPGPFERTEIAGGVLRKTYKFQGVPMGEGDEDYRTYFRTLKKIGFDGFFSYEICGPVVGGGGEKNLDKCSKKSLEFMKSLS